MSKIYKKKIISEVEVDMIKCDKCSIETAFCMAIDTWGEVDNETYCYQCQEKYKVIWFESKIK